MQAVIRTTANLTPTRKRYLPRKDNQASYLATKRKKALGLPPIPADAHFVIPEKLRTFSDGELFVLHDTGVDDEKVREGNVLWFFWILADAYSFQRIIVLGDQGIRASLAGVTSIYGDGTFDRCCLQSRHGHLHDPDPEKRICRFSQVS